MGRGMPFWKKEKQEVVQQVAKPKPPEAAKAAPPAASPKDAPKGDANETLHTAHGGLVALGLTTGATRDIFVKRAAAYPGGSEAFLKLHAAEPHKANTLLLGQWLGVAAKTDFDPQAFLAEVNPRLSSFGFSIGMQDVTWLDKDLGLRKARFRLGELEKVVRFKDPRDFVKGINELVAPRKVALIELETWSDDHAFLLVREPNWTALAQTELVVVKDPRTATGGQCGECGANVGIHWYDCLSCGAVLG